MTFGTSSVNGRDMQEKKEKVEKLLLLEKRRHGWACDLLSLLQLTFAPGDKEIHLSVTFLVAWYKGLSDKQKEAAATADLYNFYLKKVRGPLHNVMENDLAKQFNGAKKTKL